MRERFDVLIVGGGPVGACLAGLLARSGASLRVGILEPNRPGGAADATPDLRVSALSRASERLLAACGAWPRILAHGVSPYERMHVWHADAAPRGGEALVFDAAEVGEPNLGCIVENRALQRALLEAFEEAGGRVVPAELRDVGIGEEHATLGTTAGTLAARLVVGADGARSAVRAAVGLTADSAEYRQTAIVANVTTQLPHERTAWQRFLGAGTLALLPLADGASSIVWSVDDARAEALLAAPAAEFEGELERAGDGVLGAVRLASERLSFPLRRMSAHRYVVQRCALVGDAAHIVHPLAGQGLNLGLLDVAALAELIVAACSEREDPGALRILRRYERWRRSENELMSAAIDSFDRLLAHGSGPLARLAQRGLGWVNRSQEVKRLFIGRALGTAGDLPALARRPGGA